MLRIKRRIVRAPKLVLSSNNVGGRGMRNLADKLSEKVGYRVLRVLPHRVRNRPVVSFLPGIDKREQFNRFHGAGVSCPGHCLHGDGVDNLRTKRIVARRLTTASEGRGITIFEKGTTPPPAPLYTEYIVKKKEFRVQIYDNQVIDVSEKRKRRGYEGERDNLVRNSANGYVFCRDAITEPSDLRPLALSAVASLGDNVVVDGRSFWRPRSQGAVDVIWSEKLNKCFVLEVNSRPGMEGTTVERYASAICRKFGLGQ